MKNIRNDTRNDQNDDILSPEELIYFARRKSPFYRSLYKSLPEITPFKNIPILDHSEFWRAHNSVKNTLLTGPVQNGLVLSSGGSTGNPKYSIFTKSEWKTFVQINAKAFLDSPIENGDRIGNLFHTGNLYGSFIFTTQFLDACKKNLIQFPIGGQTESSEVLKFTQLFNINVLIGPPSTLLSVATYFKNKKIKSILNQINKLFYAGQFLTENQRNYLKSIFPNAQIFSIGYASNDAGVIGYADTTCRLNEHRSFCEHTILEIIDEKTKAPIDEMGVEGKLVITNLFRKLVPQIRYPVGDRGMWSEPKGTFDRKFKLLGRSDEGVKIGTLMIFTDDIAKIINKYAYKLKILDFQLDIDRYKKCTELKLIIASQLNKKNLQSHTNRIIKDILEIYPTYKLLEYSGQIAPLKIVWIKESDLKINRKTGKLLRTIDQID